MRVLVATARPDHGMAVLDGKLYTSGGFDGDSLSSVERPHSSTTRPRMWWRLPPRTVVRSMALGWDFLFESSGAFVVYAKTQPGPAPEHIFSCCSPVSSETPTTPFSDSV